MEATVVFSKRAEKSLHKIPKQILILLDQWVEAIEGQRSSSLNRSWRVIYVYSEETNQIIINVIEVINHDY